IVVTDVAQGLANGFAFGPTVRAALACQVWIFAGLTLPVLAFASLTGSTTEAFVGALGLFALTIAVLCARAFLLSTDPTAMTGYAWIPSTVREAVIFVGAAFVLLVQYRGRRTWTARAVFFAALVLGLCAPLLPWRASLGVEQLLTASS